MPGMKNVNWQNAEISELRSNRFLLIIRSGRLLKRVFVSGNTAHELLS